MSIRLSKINADNKDLILEFLNQAGDALDTFRYFNKRGLEVIQNHILTVIVTVNDKPCGYGHLDRENENVWLGVAIATPYQGKGLGKIIMKELIEYAKESNIPTLTLSVDKINSRAIRLYENIGFVLAETHSTYYIYRLSLTENQVK